MKSAKYHECPECHRISPGLQMRCECGYRFTGDRSAERRYKTCSACGSLLPAGRIFCDCGRFLPFRDRGITQGDVDAAYQAGRVDGMTEERERGDAAWDQFFKDAQLKNTVTGAPIRSREDFRLWKRQFDAAKAEIARRKAAQQEAVYMMEAEDGSTVRVPASKLESWQKAQKGPDRPLTPAEEKVKERILGRLYGPKGEDGGR